MMNFDGKELRDGFEQAFGRSIETLTEAQLRWLLNVTKHCRGRCRSNAALYNWAGRNFPHARIRDVQEEGAQFPHMEITIKK